MTRVATTRTLEVLQIRVDRISPNPQQPRRDLDEAELASLVASIKTHGIIQPIVVTPDGSKREVFQIVVGERRWRAAKLAGFSTISAIVRNVHEQEKLELALVENIQRSNLNPLEEAHAFKRLEDEFDLSYEDIAKKVGYARPTVSNAVRLLTLPREIQRGLTEGKITQAHARAILAVVGPERQRHLYARIITEQLNVRDANQLVHEIKGSRVKKHGIRRGEKVPDPGLREMERELEGRVGTAVTIRRHGNGGTVIIDFYSEEELEGIVKGL